MNDIFCIISAIGVEYGVFPYQKRLDQLIGTIKSIKQYKPNAKICLMEVSDTPIRQADAQVLNILVDKLFLLHDHKFVKEILINLDDKDTNRGARKTIGELIGMLEFLGWLRLQNVEYDRVFKIAGRLSLNENFPLLDYSQHKNQVVLSKRLWYNKDAYLIQLWSFDFKLLETMFKVFIEIWDHEMNQLRNTQTLEIVETVLFKKLASNNVDVYEHDGYLGVEGKHGQDGADVYA